MSAQTEKRIDELRSACKSCFESKAFLHGTKELAPVIAQKPNLTVYPDRDRRRTSTPDYVVRGLRNLKRIFGEDGNGRFALEAFLEHETGEFVLTFKKLFYLLSPLSKWQYWEFMRMARKAGILRVKYKKTEHVRTVGDPEAGECRMERTRWSTQIRLKPNIPKLNELLSSLEDLKQVIPGSGQWRPPPPHPDGFAIATRQEYFRVFTSYCDPPLLPPAKPAWLPVTELVDHHTEVRKWHELLIGRAWADKMFDISCWVAGKANPYYNRDCDRRKNRVPGYLDPLFKALPNYYSVDPANNAFRQQERFYGDFWISTCEAEIRKAAGNITHHQYLKGMRLLEQAGILHRTYDRTSSRGKRLFIRLDYARLLWVFANVDQWKMEKRGKAEEIMSKALRFLNNVEKGHFTAPGSMTLNLASNNSEDHQLPVHSPDASHPQPPFAGDVVAFGTMFRELPASPGRAYANLSRNAIESVCPAPSIPANGNLAEAVFTGPVDREGQQILRWLARMFSRPAITNDVVRRVQRLRHLPGHQKLTVQKLEQFEVEVFGKCAMFTRLPEWVFNLIDDPVNDLGSYEEETQAEEEQKERLDLFLKAWANHVSVALAALRLGDYQEVAYFVDELDYDTEIWRQRMRQLELAPWKFLDWVLPGGRGCDVSIRSCGFSLESIAPGLFLAFHRLRCAPEAIGLVLAPLVRKILSEAPAWFLKTDPICGWSTKLGMSAEEVALLTFEGEKEIRRAKAIVQRASDLGLDTNSHVGRPYRLAPQDFVDDPPASLRPPSTPVSQPDSSVPDDEALRLAVEFGIISQNDLEAVAAKRLARSAARASVRMAA